ncbi:MAG: hypothetical protein GEU80_09230 [Dehalococcoidia bacterium]|nr:hypothetical protein [Dehalococcoidia bacterium]
MPSETSPWWQAKVAELTENAADNAPTTDIYRKVVRLAADEEAAIPNDERMRSPAERTVRDLVKAHRARSPEERGPFRHVRWPETFISGLLPWEAARTVLDVLPINPERRITVGWARWYYRLCLAAPDAPRADLHWSATNIAQCEALELPVDWRALECWLALSPWEGEEAAQRYHDACQAQRIERWFRGATRDMRLNELRAFARAWNIPIREIKKGGE